jgi:divalent metal cation (Fe/Co/Zn/Cd) transporter
MNEECHNCNFLDSCCTKSHIVWHEEQVRNGVLLEYFSLGWMSIEVIASVIAGLIVGRSFALLAFGGDSVIELISAYAVLGYLRKLRAGISAGETESERTEKIATLLLVLLIPIITGGAVYSFYSGIKPESSLLGIAVAIGAVIIMPVLWTQKKRIGVNGNILPLKIDAIESATCFFMSVALLGGLLINFFLHFSWVDYIATAIILGFVFLEIKESIEDVRRE